MRFSLVFAAALLAASGAGYAPLDRAAAIAAAPAEPAAPQQQAPAFYRFKLGGLIVTALSDGTAAIPWDTILQGMPPERIRAIFADLGETTLRDTSINAFVVDTGSQRILIDAGAGGLFGDCCGRLPAVLSAAGYPAQTIDAVLLTHVHGDHSGGLVANGARVFTNADIYLARSEYDYWMSDRARKQAPASHKAMFDEGRVALAPYDAAGRLKFFSGTTALFPEITAIPAPGHTPGHTFYRIASAGEHLLVVGDIIHAAEVQLPFPAVTAQFDVDPDQARATRERTFAELAKTQELVAADHVSFPGLGRITQDAGTYHWIAMPYQGAVTRAAD